MRGKTASSSVRLALLVSLCGLTACEGFDTARIEGEFHPGIPATTGRGPFAQSWPFDFATTSGYAYDPTQIDFTGGVCRLTPADQVDDDDTANGFAGGSLVGAAYDATDSALRLSQAGTPTNHAELDSSWTPQWGSLVSYFTLNGSGSLANGSAISSVIGPNGVARNANGTGMAYVAGKMGTAVNFDPTDDYIDLGNPAELNFTGAFTLSAWINISAFNSYQGIITKGYATTGGYSFNVRNDLSLWFEIDGTSRK